jgi:hypothetical protein
MDATDWRSADAYEELRLLDAPAFAFEFLRHNPEFLKDYARLARKSGRQPLDPAEADAFAAAGGCDFEKGLPELAADAAQWTARVLPSVVALAAAPEDLTNPSFGLASRSLGVLTAEHLSHFLVLAGARLRIQMLDRIGPCAVVLPIDQLFEIRAAAALRLWRGLVGHRPGPDPSVLTAERRKRFILALRALDARLLGTTYPDIAAGLFDTTPISRRDWISHELRDQTGRLVRLGFKMMRGGYRQLLVHPYRRRI